MSDEFRVSIVIGDTEGTTLIHGSRSQTFLTTEAEGMTTEDIDMVHAQLDRVVEETKQEVGHQLGELRSRLERS